METVQLDRHEYHVIPSRFLKYEGRDIEIVATQITGNGPNDTQHTLRGQNQTKVVKHSQLVSLWKAGKIKFKTKKS